MKKNKFLFIVFALVLMLPFNVKADDNKNYTADIKNLEDYLCEELKGHNLEVSMQTYNMLVVHDVDTGKDYWLDFSNIGVCQEFDYLDFDDSIVPTEYSWEGNNLYLETYSLDYLYLNAKTLDEEFDPKGVYAELKTDGFYFVENPTKENFSNYYETYFFKLATGEYDKDETYYEFKVHKYSTNNYDGEYELAELITLQENTYVPNKYYVLAEPVKKELIAKFDLDTFEVPKEKSGLSTDLSLSKSDFLYHFEFGNKTYFVFSNLNESNLYSAIFDEEGNYETLGLDNLLPMLIDTTKDNKYLSLLAKVDGKNHIVLLDKNSNIMVLYDVSQYGDDLFFIGYHGNEFYYLMGSNNKILEIDYLGFPESFTVTFDANGGLFGDETIYRIEEWNADLYDHMIQPTREGFAFKGYYTEKTGGIKFEMILNESGIDRDMTFYAQWEEGSTAVQETPEEEPPQTFDGIGNSLLFGAISLISLMGIIKYLRKYN